MALVIAFVKTCNYELAPEREQKPRLLCVCVWGGGGGPWVFFWVFFLVLVGGGGGILRCSHVYLFFVCPQLPDVARRFLSVPKEWPSYTMNKTIRAS